MIKLPNKTKGIILGAVWGVFLLITVIAGAAGETSEKTTEMPMPVENVAVDRQMPEAVDSTTPTPIPSEEHLQPESEPDEETKEKSSDTVSTAYTTDVVNIREQPNTDCEILGKTKLGDEVTVLGTEGDWSHVMTNGTDGYIKSEYLSDKPEGTSAENGANSGDGTAASVSNDQGATSSESKGNPDALANYVPAGAPTGTTIVNASNGKIHDAGCSKLPDEDNRIYFNSVEEALAAGYSDRCGICNPR